MNVTLEKTDKVNGVLTISLVKEDYEADYKKKLNEYGRKHPAKGFRPGHMPAGLLKKYYGGEAMSYVVDRKVSEALSKYIIDNKLNLLGEPVLSKDTNVDLMKGEEFTFKFNLGFEPEFDVKVNNELTIPYYKIDVTDKMVEEHDEQYRKRYAKQVAGEEVEENALVRGNLVELAEDGSVKEGGVSNERAVLSPVHFKDEEQKALFIGKKKGDEVVYNPYKASDGSAAELASLLNIDREKVEEHKGDFRFTIDDIMVSQTAEYDQELFDLVLGRGEAKTKEEYLVKLREMLERQFVTDSNYRFSIDARQKIMETVGELELPDEILKEFLLMRNEKATREQVEEEYPSARPEIVWTLIRGKLIRQMGVKVEDEDRMKLARFYVARQYAQYGMMNVPEDLINEGATRLLEDQHQNEDITERCLDDKVYDAIRNAVTLSEQTVSVEEFNALFSDGKEE